MKLTDLHPAEQLAIMIRRVYDRRLTTTSGGNLSIKDEKDNIWITPGGIDKGSLTKDDMVCVKPDGTMIGRHKPSSEYPFHMRIYEARKDIHAVLHAHPSGLVAFSIVRQLPLMGLLAPTAIDCGTVGMAPYAMTGSVKLGENIAEVFRKGHNVVMLENHGVVAGAEDMLLTFGLFESMEYAARIQIRASGTGNLRSLSDADILKAKENIPVQMEDMPAMMYSEEENAIRTEICKLAVRAYRQGITISQQGAFSVRVSEERFVITPSRTDCMSLTEKEIVAIDHGQKEAGKTPSRTVQIHHAIYRKHPEVNSIIISQPVNVMAFAVTDAQLDSRTIPESYLMMRDIHRVSSKRWLEHPECIADEISSDTPMVLAENAALVVTGSDLLNAFDRLEVAEYSAMSIVMSKKLGDIIPIDESGLAEIREKFHLT